MGYKRARALYKTYGQVSEFKDQSMLISREIRFNFANKIDKNFPDWPINKNNHTKI